SDGDGMGRLNPVLPVIYPIPKTTCKNKDVLIYFDRPIPADCAVDNSMFGHDFSRLAALSSRFCAAASAPAQAPEKARDLSRATVGVFRRRKMSTPGERSQIEGCKGFPEPVGPGVREKWIVFCPAHASRRRNRRKSRRLALDHGDASRMRGAVMSKTARE